MKKGLISRRHVLRGVGHVAIALPMLEAMGEATGWKSLGGRTAYGATGFPKRFVTVFTGSGTLIDKWRPTGTETNFTFGPITAPLTPHKDKIVVIDGYLANGANDAGVGSGHVGRMGAALTGVPLVPTSSG